MREKKKKKAADLSELKGFLEDSYVRAIAEATRKEEVECLVVEASHFFKFKVPHYLYWPEHPPKKPSDHRVRILYAGYVRIKELKQEKE